ncbi:MAG: hypothetical protein J5U19_11155, partial [Candidatus Methanoperedens sp.]|nr:hypothetical protein [Candidatus Methanoperedens sp.]
SNIAIRTLNVWSNLQLYKKSSGYNFIGSYDNAVMSTSNSPTNSQYPYILGSSQIIQYWDDVRIVPLDPNNNIVTSGNLTTWYNAGNGNETYKLDVNATIPGSTNYTVWYRQNNTGSFTQAGGVNTGNSTITLDPKFQNTDVRVRLNGNKTATPEIISITFYNQG